MDAGIGVSILADDGDRRMPPRCGFCELDVDVGKVAHIREHPDLGLSGLAPDDRLKLAVDRELHIPWSSGSDGSAGTSLSALPPAATKRCRLLGMNWKVPRRLWIDSGPAYQTVKYFVPGFDCLKLTGASDG